MNYLLGYQITLKNAKKHYEIAELIKEISFGIGNSHLITCAEELVKAEFLFSLHLLPEIADKAPDFKKYFSKHQFKHQSANSNEKLSFLLENMVDKFINPITQYIDEKEDITSEDISLAKGKGFDNLLEWFNKVNNDEIKVKENKEWWKQAEHNRKAGLYVDYNKDGSWNSPDQVKEKKYIKSKKIVLDLLLKVESYEKQIDDELVSSSLKEIKNKVIDLYNKKQ